MDLYRPYAKQCADKSTQICDSYRCHVGITVGVTPNNLSQSQHICNMFPGVEGCVAEQACSAYFPMSTSMYQSCNKTVQCIEDSAPKNANVIWKENCSWYLLSACNVFHNVWRGSDSTSIFQYSVGRPWWILKWVGLGTVLGCMPLNSKRQMLTKRLQFQQMIPTQFRQNRFNLNLRGVQHWHTHTLTHSHMHTCRKSFLFFRKGPLGRERLQLGNNYK